MPQYTVSIEIQTNLTKMQMQFSPEFFENADEKQRAAFFELMRKRIAQCREIDFNGLMVAQPKKPT